MSLKKTNKQQNPLDQVNNNHWVKKTQNYRRVWGLWAIDRGCCLLPTQKKTGSENRNQVSSCGTEQLQSCCHKSDCVGSLLSGSFHPSQRETCSPSTSHTTHPNHSLTNAFFFLYLPPVAGFGHVTWTRCKLDINISSQYASVLRSFGVSKVCKPVN